MVKSKDKEIINFYEKIPKDLIKKYKNPSYDNTLIKHPARILIAGASGSMKTNCCLNFIYKMKNTFDLIILCCKSSDEPLYDFLKLQLDEDQLHVYENGEVPCPEQYNTKEHKDKQICIIFDDLVNDDQTPIIEFFIRGRKIAKGCTMLMLTQSFYKCKKTIRVQCNIIIIKKLSSLKDLQNLLDDFALEDKDTLFNMYKYATQEKESFLLIDCENDDKRYRKNFTEILNPEEFKNCS
jgi:hypothetical protein